MQFIKLQQNLFLIILLLITVIFIWLVHPYLQAIFWAVILAIIFYPVQYLWLKVTKEHKTVSALLTMLSVFIVVLVPLYFLGQAMVKESVDIYRQFSGGSQLSKAQVTQSIQPVFVLAEQFGIEQTEVQAKIAQGVKRLGEFFASRAVSVGQDAVQFTIRLFVMLYVLFYLFKEGRELVKKLMHVIPLGDVKEKRLISRFSATVRATIKGTFIIGIIQGFMGGLLFWLVGIPGAVLWGAVMTVLSVIPAVGSVLVWLPAGLILLFSGQVWQGIVVLAVGAVIIGSIDNILRPPLVGKDTEMPDVLVLLSTLGGLTVFGIAGFIIGPIIAAFFLTLWSMFEEEYRKELKKIG